MSGSVEQGKLALVESVAGILLELLCRQDIDTDILTNYWGGETPTDFILEGNEDDLAWSKKYY